MLIYSVIVVVIPCFELQNVLNVFNEFKMKIYDLVT